MEVLASLEAKPASRAKGARRRDPSPLAVRGERRGRQAAFSSFAGVAQRLLQIAGTLIVMPMVLHAVGSEGFGVWAAAASFFWMTVVVDFGVGQALLTSVAQNVARGDIAEIRRQIGAALLASLVLGLSGNNSRNHDHSQNRIARGRGRLSDRGGPPFDQHPA